MQPHSFIRLIILILFLTACSKDDSTSTFLEPEVVNPSPDQPDNNSDNPEDQSPSDSEAVGEIFVFKEELVDPSHLLVNDAFNNRVYLMNKEAEILHEWELKSGLGNDCVLQEDGTLLSLLEATSPEITFGGFGGLLQIITPENAIAWEYPISSYEEIAHHDTEMLPNGNLLVLVWKRKSAHEAQDSGFKYNYDIFPESIYEIEISSKEIVWQWNSWDHLIQDSDPNKPNYGNISKHPERIDINYNPNESGDIMHANGIEYDESRDLIYISINFYSEVWIIDHSTTTAEASGSTGGNYNKGGDLIYRFGNPQAYSSPFGERLFYNNHFPNLKLNGNYDTLLLFMNGNNGDTQSTVYEFALPSTFELLNDQKNELEILWEFSHPDLYSSKVSGAIELPNGNILITEGDFGAWEVTRTKEVVWKFNGEGFFWRIYPYDNSSPALAPFNID
ncbi:aryl-sulfate sulfotransferase [Croceiramulus getboli]|nr:aryl-sulfate sulfotransferase [Flavobacteriaceae bacterium YJPT1-3]